ncbi:MAG TPA: hypothetical protein VGB97_03600 [Candidatus Paceibacterota bacterium]|jgi:hypothetical protein
MKELLFGIVLILVLGIGGFVYRNVLERPDIGLNLPQECNADAKVCPNGATLGRSEPGCAFPACPLPNIELATLGIAFALPPGYVENRNAPMPGDDLIAAYEKASVTTGVPHVIVLRRYAIPAGKTANDVMLAETSYDTSGEPVKAMSEFTPVAIGGRNFYRITTDRFEAQVHTVYYLPRASDVLRFEVLELDVTNWTDPSLVVTDLPEHRALTTLLEKLQTN